MSDCDKCNPPAKIPDCKACSEVAWYAAKTDSEGRCLKCHKQVWPEGARPLREEEKNVQATTRN
jgi:hypothetical protein